MSAEPRAMCQNMLCKEYAAGTNLLGGCPGCGGKLIRFMTRDEHQDALAAGADVEFVGVLRHQAKVNNRMRKAARGG